MPLFHRRYGGDDYAFSDDGNLFAYIARVGDSSVRRLHVCSVLEPTKNLLPIGVCDELQALCGYMVMWVDSRTILLYPDVGYPARMKKEPVRLICVSDFRICNLLEVYGSYGPKALSPSKRYIMVSDSFENIVSPTLYRLHIIDLLNGQKISEILPDGKEMAAHGAVWSSDNEIVYAVDNVVYTQQIGSAKKREVVRMKAKRGIWLYAVDGKRNLHYQVFADTGGYSETVGGWRIYNLDTKEDRELTGNQIKGKVLMSRMRDKIVTTVGY